MLASRSNNFSYTQCIYPMTCKGGLLEECFQECTPWIKAHLHQAYREYLCGDSKKEFFQLSELTSEFFCGSVLQESIYKGSPYRFRELPDEMVRLWNTLAGRQVTLLKTIQANDPAFKTSFSAGRLHPTYRAD